MMEPVSNVEPSCGKCRFNKDGQCRRFPPVLDGMGSVFPPVIEADWCGEFKPSRAAEDHAFLKYIHRNS